MGQGLASKRGGCTSPWGFQAAPTMTARPQHVQLGSAESVKLVADLFVSGAGQLVIDGNGNRATVVVGEWQIRVQHGAELHLKRIAVSLSTESAAIVAVKARVLATEAPFRDCYTHANAYQVTWAAAGRGVLVGEGFARAAWF